MECLRPISISVSRLCVKDLENLEPQATSLTLQSCTAEDWSSVLAAIRSRCTKLTHVHMHNMPVGDLIAEQLLEVGGYKLK